MFIIVRAIASVVFGRTVYEVEWIAECTLTEAVNKLNSLRKAGGKDVYILSVAFDK
jgi:hypothetical protein